MATFKHNNTPYHGVIINDICPYDYCREDTDSLSIHLEFPDDQCAFNRSKILCGTCQDSLSQVLGNSKCMKCSNSKLPGIIAVIFIAGVLLVAFLMPLNLTVSVGTINGLIFYANIIRETQNIIFPQAANTSFLTLFVAWLNLDLGIEACFYDGLDAYLKVWLQFVFPLYIWVIVSTIVIVSHYLSLISQWTPSNAPQVLATLFLLSYAKIMRIVITVFSSTVLLYPNGFKERVWLYDGNVGFLKGKHIPLFIATFILFVFLTVPYTFSLFCIQWLQRFSNYRPLFWIHRLMPLFDAYTGLYQHKHRYWPGFLLLVWVVVLISFSQNYNNDPAINLLIIAIISFALSIYASYVNVYKNKFKSILEISFLLNLGFLSITIFYQLVHDKSSILPALLSIGSAFLQFVIIVLYHGVLQVLSLRNIKSAKALLSTLIVILHRLEKDNIICRINY